MTVFARNGLARAGKTSIAPAALELGIINLMPNKAETEEQFLGIFEQSDLALGVTFFYPATHHFKNQRASQIKQHYLSLCQAKSRQIDGWIVTGAPVEQLPFDEVDYWIELQDKISSLADQQTPVIYECWAAQAALNVLYGFDKKLRPSKLSGIYSAKKIVADSPLTRGFGTGGPLRMPQSRHTDLVLPATGLPAEVQILAQAPEVGPLLLADYEANAVFVTGHPEYTREVLDQEYRRDVRRGLAVHRPLNYYADPSKQTINYSWSHASFRFYQNWLDQAAEKKVVKNL